MNDFAYGVYLDKYFLYRAYGHSHDVAKHMAEEYVKSVHLVWDDKMKWENENKTNRKSKMAYESSRYRTGIDFVGELCNVYPECIGNYDKWIITRQD